MTDSEKDVLSKQAKALRRADQTAWNTPIVLTSPSIGEAWLRYLREVIDKGHRYFDGAEVIIERENVVLQIQDDDPSDPLLAQYADDRIMRLYLQKMQSREVVAELNASYGKRLYDQLGINQFSWLVDRLTQKRESKAATISFLLPNDPGPRIPCLTTLDFKVRNDILYTKVFFRSQNALRAYGNFRSIFWLARSVATEIGASTGAATICVSNAHILDSDEPKARIILDDWKSN
jgi:thymidylate synthase